MPDVDQRVIRKVSEIWHDCRLPKGEGVHLKKFSLAISAFIKEECEKFKAQNPPVPLEEYKSFSDECRGHWLGGDDGNGKS